MITKEKIVAFNALDAEEAELSDELRRIDGFFVREPGNRDNARAVDKGHIMVKFAGTACRLPVGIFEAELRKRKVAIASRLTELKAEKEAI